MGVELMLERTRAPVQDLPTLASFPVFVISLARRADRRAHMERVIADCGLKAEFVDAVDGRRLTQAQRSCYDRWKALAIYGADMSAAELACHLSHLAIYRRIVNDGIDVALVLEDDVECDHDLLQLVDAVACESRADWLVLRLQSTKGEVVDGSRPDARGEDIEHVRGRTVSRIRTGVLGGCGYLIKQEGARRMLRYASRPFMPIDQTMDRYWENGIMPYVLRPFPVRQSPAIDSEIGARKVVVGSPLALKLLRRSHRAMDGVNKRCFKLMHSLGQHQLAGAVDALGLTRRTVPLRPVKSGAR